MKQKEKKWAAERRMSLPPLLLMGAKLCAKWGGVGRGCSGTRERERERCPFSSSLGMLTQHPLIISSSIFWCIFGGICIADVGGGQQQKRSTWTEGQKKGQQPPHKLLLVLFIIIYHLSLQKNSVCRGGRFFFFDNKREISDREGEGA